MLSGTQGTGKGSLVSDVLTPLIGEEYVCATDLPALQGDFNGFIEGKLLVLIDESEASELRERRKVMARLKRLVTERSIQINRKGQNQYTALNRANFILASNKYDPVEVDAGDRRFNVAPRQEQKILDKFGGPMTRKEITEGVRSELYEFAGYLLSRKADTELASIPIHTEDRERLKDLTISTAQNIANKLREGNLEFFVDYWPAERRTAFVRTLDRPTRSTDVLTHTRRSI